MLENIIGVVIAVFIAYVVLSIPVLALSKLITRILARWVTPPAHKRYGNIRESEGNVSLRADGYSVTVDWSTDAVASLMKARGK